MRWLAIGVAGVVLFYGAVGSWGSDLMIGENPRWRGITRGPQDIGLVGETVSFIAAGGVRIKAWWLPATASTRGTVIFAPGGNHTRQAMLARAAFLVRGGYDVLAIDLRGHGESDGQFISPGLAVASTPRRVARTGFDSMIRRNDGGLGSRPEALSGVARSRRRLAPEFAAGDAER